MGTLYSVTTGYFREAEPQRLLFGDEPKGRTVPSVPLAELGDFGERTFRNVKLTGRRSPQAEETQLRSC